MILPYYIPAAGVRQPGTAVNAVYSKGSRLVAGAFAGYQLVVVSGFGSIALDFCLFQFGLDLRQTGACGDQLADDDVFL